MGVAGNIHSAGNVNAKDFFFSNGATVSSVIGGAITSSIPTTISLTGTSGTGTVSVGGTLTFGGTYGVTASASSSTITVGTPQDLRTNASPTFSNVTVSNVLTSNTLSVSSNRTSTSTVTGAVTVTGGLGVGGNVWASNIYAGDLFFSNGATISSVIGSAITGSISTNFNLAGTSGTGSVNGGGTITFAGSHGVTAIVSSSTITIDTPQDLRTNASPTFSNITVSNNRTSTSTTTGAVTIVGGLGVGGNVWAGNIYVGDLFFANGVTVSSVISGGVTGYTLPTATTSVLGGVKIDGTTITINGSGVISAAGYTLPTATNSVLGGVKIDTTTITINGSGVISTAQDIRTTASPSFANITMTGNLTPSANLTYNIGSSSNWWNNVYGTAIRALYADLAENYAGDREYEPGTVLIFGGEQEVTECTKYCDARVAGAVSTNPAYLMNGALENGTPIALRGRVPVKVIGPVAKGDLLVTSDTPGHAVAVSPDVNYGPAVFAKAIQNKSSEGAGLIEAVIL
jgi:hypothetical protein